MTSGAEDSNMVAWNWDAFHVRILCIMPWNPPCPNNSCNLIISILNKCVSIIMSPDSYTPDDSSCKAQGTVPIGKFLYGMDQYLNLVKDYRKIVAGIPWHGYKYNCSTLDGDTCMLSKTEKKCNFNDRQKVQFVELGPKYGLSVDKGTVDNITQSVFYNSKEGDRKIQLWFENHDTLVLKYRLVKDLNLQGFAIWYAEDLTYGISMKKLNFDKEMSKVAY
nr:hypothetical protein BaRGS_012738 [Batillaria attramentaria]